MKLEPKLYLIYSIMAKILSSLVHDNYLCQQLLFTLVKLNLQ
jgi:hypothetical protein